MRFQPPPHRTQRADFPHWAHLFAWCQDLWGLSCRGDFRSCPSLQLVIVKQTQPVVQPFATPPLPAEAFASPGTHQMLPDLLLYPALDHGKTRTRMSDPKVVHPATQDRIDFHNHILDGPADMLPEDLPELLKQRCPLLQLGRIVRSPLPPKA